MSIVVNDCRPINGSCVIAARIFTNDVVAAIVPLKTLPSVSKTPLHVVPLYVGNFLVTKQFNLRPFNDNAR